MFHLRLVGKLVEKLIVDFRLVITEFFAECYGSLVCGGSEV